MPITLSRFTLLLSCLFCVQSFFAQVGSQEFIRKSTKILKSTENIVLDGELNESAWAKAIVEDDFVMQSPVDGEPANERTEVRMLYDDKNIYVSAVCYDDQNHIIQTLKRDNFGDNDEFGVIFDPVNQKSYGFAFGVNVLGAQAEALVSENDVDDSWDNKWYVQTKQYADHWIVEMAIPFKTLRYESQKSTWGVQFVRIEPSKNETYVWSPVPRQFDFTDIGYLGSMEWEEAPQKAGSNIAIIPYSTLRVNKDFNSEEGTEVDADIGGDVKIALTPNLNLDLTFNPDFSQVDVDAQVTNLTRFSIFFPEKRQFFLENSDIFNGFGQFANSPFYSRRIGLDGSGRQVPILYGVRLSGYLSERLRVGVLNMHTDGDENRFAQNYSAVVFQQRLWERSSIKGIFLNRQAFNNGEMVSDDFGRNAGGEFNYNTPDGKIQTQAGYIHSFKEGINEKNGHLYGRFDYNGQLFRTFFAVQNVGQNYSADMGFNGRLLNFNPETGEVVRIGYTQFSNMLNYYIYPKESEKLNFHWSGIENFVYVNEGGELNEWYLRLRHFWFYKNTSQLRLRLNYNYVNLVFPFALTNPAIPVDKYHMYEANVQFNTDLRKTINTEMFVVYGSFYGGTKLTYRAFAAYRIQPWVNFLVGFEQNKIWLDDPYGNLDVTFASFQSEVSFSTKLFWTSYLQYNTQSDNFNINSRLQWRFAPMADLFLVYNDNYLVEGMFGPKNRSIILKANYWISI